MFIVVKKFDGSKARMEVDAKQTVKSFKDELAEKTGISSPQLRLVYNARIMEERETFMDVNVQPETTIYLVVALHG